MSDAIASLLGFISKSNQMGVIEGIAITVQFKDSSHRVWVAHHGALDLDGLQSALKGASESPPEPLPFYMLDVLPEGTVRGPDR